MAESNKLPGSLNTLPGSLNKLPPHLKKNWKKLPGNANSVGSKIVPGVEKPIKNVRASAHSSNVVRNSIFNLNERTKQATGQPSGRIYYGPWEYVKVENQEPRMRHYLFSDNELQKMEVSEDLKLRMLVPTNIQTVIDNITRLRKEKKEKTPLQQRVTQGTIDQHISSLTSLLQKREVPLFYDSIQNRIYEASVIDNGNPLCKQLKNGGFLPEETECLTPKNTPAAGGKRKTKRMKRSLKKTKQRNKPSA